MLSIAQEISKANLGSIPNPREISKARNLGRLPNPRDLVVLSLFQRSGVSLTKHFLCGKSTRMGTVSRTSLVTSIHSCEWNPFYITKRYDGLDPKFGGHPTDLDVNYAFFGPSPFGGQPYPGTPHHCKLEAGDDIKAGDCPKLETLTDKGPFGPGHVPPHIALAALTWLVVKTCRHKHIFGMNLHILQNI